MSLKGMTVLVTNAARGSGLACAHALAAAGAGLVFCASDEEDVIRVEAELQQHGVAVYGMKADISRSREVETLFGEALRVFGALDGVVVLPAVAPDKSLSETDDESFDKAMAAGVRAAYVVCQRAARIMTGRGGGGAIVLVGPAASHAAGPMAAVTRDALGALARALAAELQPQAIRVNAVVQGPQDERDASIAALATFLMGEAAAGLTGAVMDLGGGGAA